MAVSQELLELVCCPKCKGRVEATAAGDGLVCPACKLLYPIVDDIPQFLIDEARPYEPTPSA